MGNEITATIDAVWRMESAKLVAGLARMVGDVGLAEDFAQDALVAALEHWPESGVPDNPGAWLMATAKRRAIDRMRRDRRLQEKYAALGREMDLERALSEQESEPETISDDLLRLMFTACHPVLPREGRIGLTLRLLGGLTTAEIARAYLVQESTIAQRISRAKRTLREKGVPFEAPAGEELDERLPSVLEVIYLVFNEGYTATAGDDWMRPALCEEAMRLGRVLAGLAPREPEVHGLVALMELQASRTKARTGPDGEPVLLLDQDRTRWDRLLIGRGLAALERAEQLDGNGTYVLQASIAACHARAIRAEDTDWERIASLYGTLAEVMPSPIVELNRSVAVAMAHGPAAGLAITDALLEEPALRNYHLLPSVRGDFLAKLGRHAEAGEAFAQAAALAGNARERTLLEERAANAQQAAATGAH